MPPILHHKQICHREQICHPEQSEGSAFAFAVAFLAVIPEGDLLLFLPFYPPTSSNSGTTPYPMSKTCPTANASRRQAFVSISSCFSKSADPESLAAIPTAPTQ
jgi:hypothetical protein